MNKAEALVFLEEKAKEGYITHPKILDIFNDEEEVAESFLSMMYSKPKLRQTILLGSQEMFDALDEALEKKAEVLFIIKRRRKPE